MTEVRCRERPTYATSLLLPFAELLEGYDEIPELLEQMLENAGDRVLVEVAHSALEMAVDFTRDPDLGLRAARRLVLGDVGAVDYVVRSAPTVREALEDAARYIRLINEVLEVRLEIDGSTAFVHLENSVVLPRAAADFEVGGFFCNHIAEWISGAPSEATVWFTHRAPDDLTEYLRTFPSVTLRFSAPAFGFSFPRAVLDRPVPGADANLRAVIVPYAEETLGKLAVVQSVTADVRAIIVETLELGGPDIASVAQQLGMSVRTLARRLEGEGTTFRDLADDARRKLALDYVGSRDLDLSAIAYRLGFSHTAAFHRAFRRWTGRTPLAYRRSAGR